MSKLINIFKIYEEINNNVEHQIKLERLQIQVPASFSEKMSAGAMEIKYKEKTIRWFLGGEFVVVDKNENHINGRNFYSGKKINTTEELISLLKTF